MHHFWRCNGHFVSLLFVFVHRSILWLLEELGLRGTLQLITIVRHLQGLRLVPGESASNVISHVKVCLWCCSGNRQSPCVPWRTFWRTIQILRQNLPIVLIPPTMSQADTWDLVTSHRSPRRSRSIRGLLCSR